MATKSKKITSVTIRENKGRDNSPKWEGHELWDTNQFFRQFRNSMDYYRLEFSGKDLKPKVIDWMSANGYSKEEIKAYKNTKDWRTNLTMGAIAANLLKGMPAVRADFNDGKDATVYLRESIAKIVSEGVEDISDDETVVVKNNTAPQPSIQDRVREAAFKMTEDIEDAIESFQQDPEAFDPKSIKVVNSLKGRQAKAAHARIIKDFYQSGYNDLEELQNTTDEQLKEAYSHLSKGQIKKLFGLYTEIIGACTMLMQEAKVNKKPRAKKPQPKDKLVAKLKYQKANEQLKLVSINPVDIIGAQELWVYNTKSRKIGKYVAEDMGGALSVKGTTIVGYNENNSVQKTLRKPAEQLAEFKSAGKVQLRKFLDDIKAVDIKLNGRINEDVILLKVQ